jgi:hypothetical protein
MSVNYIVKVQDAVLREKLILAQPKILATNMALTTTLLNSVKAVVESATPDGPGHFGYHGRDRVKVVVTSSGRKTIGKVTAPIQLYWREYGTGVRFRGKGRTKLQQAVRVMTGASSGGEPAFMVAHKALGTTKRFIAAAAGSFTAWWNA